MNTKQLFKTVAEHLLNQQKQSKKGGSCMYRGRAGNKCAVGCLISDEAYTEDLEGLRAKSELVVEALYTSLNYALTEIDIDLLEELQAIHDNDLVEDWEVRLDNLSNKMFEAPLYTILQEN